MFSHLRFLNIMAALQENTLLCFDAEFAKKGLASAPEGLKKLLLSYKLKKGEKPDDMRHRIYRRLWCIMWFGSKIGESAVTHGQPTYVYPQCLKDIVRALIPGELADYPDPTGTRVYSVTLEDLAKAKWPTSKKKQ